MDMSMICKKEGSHVAMNWRKDSSMSEQNVMQSEDPRKSEHAIEYVKDEDPRRGEIKSLIVCKSFSPTPRHCP